ncbi:MAG TPA: hypothetical protein VGP36_11685 [Mycobacteriales bacterium]|jgi:hypothetical protein|nr:hypothetical protein [Mycobacteriales bacterium]
MTSWGAVAAERARPLPCDRILPQADLVLHRAVDVAAPAARTFRWICQLRAAPYSFDRLDNGGRRSPRRLTPGLELLEVGQPVMRIFTLVDFTAGEQLTIRLDSERGRRWFGEGVATYAAVPAGPDRSRLLVRYRLSGLDPFRRRALVYGDLIMMRKQLRTLAHLAEHSDP